jgi:Fe-coproporphyrin III synthase
MNLLDPEIRTLEVHPVPFTRLLHRNFPSGLRDRDGLGVPVLLDAIGEAASLGYNLLRISGDNPLHCPALHSLCGEAHRHGIRTTIQLPQNELTQRLIGEFSGVVDRLAIVLDGRPIVRKRIRRCHRLTMLGQRQIPFAVIFTLTRSNLNDLEPAVQFALEHEAAALAVRTSELSEDQLATAWMVTEFLRDQCRGRLAIDFETPNRHCLPLGPGELMRWIETLAARPRTLGRVVSPLVVNSEGMLLPIRRDFPSAFAFGDLRRHSLRQLADSWIVQRGAAFAGAYADALARAQAGRSRYHKFFDLLSEEAGRSRPAVFAAAG